MPNWQSACSRLEREGCEASGHADLPLTSVASDTPSSGRSASSRYSREEILRPSRSSLTEKSRTTHRKWGKNLQMRRGRDRGAGTVKGRGRIGQGHTSLADICESKGRRHR